MHIGEESAVLYPGQMVYIPPGVVQWIENVGSEILSFLAIVDPMWRKEDEVIREEVAWIKREPDRFMQEAIAEARKGWKEGGIPIGSVLVRDGHVIGQGHNRRVQSRDPVAHAEIECLRSAGRIMNYAGCTLYSTLMPCHLCAGAVVQFGIHRVIAGEAATFPGARDFLEEHGVAVVDLDLAECRDMMATFITQEPVLWAEDIGAEVP